MDNLLKYLLVYFANHIYIVLPITLYDQATEH